MSTRLGSTREKVARALFARDCEIAIAARLARDDVPVRTRLSAGKEIVDLVSLAKAGEFGSIFTGQAFGRIGHSETRDEVIAHVVQVARDYADIVTGVKQLDRHLTEALRGNLRLSLGRADIYGDLPPEGMPLRYEYVPIVLSGYCLHLLLYQRNVATGVIEYDCVRWGETRATLLAAAQANMAALLSRARANDVHTDPQTGTIFSAWRNTTPGFDADRLAFPRTTNIAQPVPGEPRVVLFAAPRRDVFLAAECRDEAVMLHAAQVLYSAMQEEAKEAYPLITTTIFRWLPDGDYDYIIPVPLSKISDNEH